MRTYNGCRFSYDLSAVVPLTWRAADCLIEVSSAIFSPICHFPQRPGAGAHPKLAHEDHRAGAVAVTESQRLPRPLRYETSADRRLRRDRSLAGMARCIGTYAPVLWVVVDPAAKVMASPTGGARPCWRVTGEQVFPELRGGHGPATVAELL
jgi:hypothetical protein